MKFQYVSSSKNISISNLDFTPYLVFASGPYGSLYGVNGCPYCFGSTTNGIQRLINCSWSTKSVFIINSSESMTFICAIGL